MKKQKKMMNYIIDAIRDIRNVRAEMNVPPSRKAKVLIYATEEAKEAFKQGKDYFEKLASAIEVEILNSKE